MFTDIVDSSAIAKAVGDGRWTETVLSYLDMTSKELDPESGRLIKLLGDGTMSTFDSAGAEIRISDAMRIMVGGSSGFNFVDPTRTKPKGLGGDHLICRPDPAR